jgi:hypothetical protein
MKTGHKQLLYAVALALLLAADFGAWGAQRGKNATSRMDSRELLADQNA